MKISTAQEYWFDKLSPMERTWLEGYIAENFVDENGDPAITLTERPAGGVNMNFDAVLPADATKDSVVADLIALWEAVKENLGVAFDFVVNVDGSAIKISGGVAYESPVKTIEQPVGDWKPLK